MRRVARQWIYPKAIDDVVLWEQHFAPREVPILELPDNHAWVA